MARPRGCSPGCLTARPIACSTPWPLCAEGDRSQMTDRHVTEWDGQRPDRSGAGGRSSGSFVDLYWLPLGAGDALPIVRWNGRLYEALAAQVQRRSRCDLYHAALEVGLDGVRHTIEMGPAWGPGPADRGSWQWARLGCGGWGGRGSSATRCGDGVTARSPTSRRPSEARGG
ncbi:MAG: hypothetical protein MZU95_09405 [Desulfomicrobium escambiense]|nr:hypothetical protein [Desulfomicrobium escambiense]